MSENLKKLFLQSNPTTTKTGAAMRVSFLFHEIEEAHGLDVARAMFEKWAKPTTQNELNKLKGWRLIERYDDMLEPNVRELARQIEAENAKLPDDEQLTPRRKPSRETIEAYIRELLRERRKAIEAGTWDGPVSEDAVWRRRPLITNGGL
ncbi:hypothetical protein N2605_16305 [Bradyrhizobium yuanmingense]|uniref:hypothetical protein n=1 Tax=Bradyrhizobium TaxID=374 RepID=UPI001CD1A20E|nr:MULTISPECIES: hypothetical protein [unclassified Bradyrhizobium]MCA1514543.1 hypothetical protein [Bradyrhizobium sp. NBAIM01]UWU87939.1 hypothetical protein N2605_16305 [Bradyrhizobium sp. CB1024]